jgi:hypothetical protein
MCVPHRHLDVSVSQQFLHDLEGRTQIKVGAAAWPLRRNTHDTDGRGQPRLTPAAAPAATGSSPAGGRCTFSRAASARPARATLGGHNSFVAWTPNDHDAARGCRSVHAAQLRMGDGGVGTVPVQPSDMLAALILALVLLLLLNAFFALAEFAAVKIRQTWVEQLETEKNPKARLDVLRESDPSVNPA